MQRHSNGFGWVGGVGALAARVAAVLLVMALAVAVGGPALGQEDEEAEGIVGTFSVAITETDLPTALPGGAGLIGVWNITFNEDGTYQAARQDVGVVINGSYEVDGDTVTVTDEGGLLSCGADLGAGGGTASYGWDVSDGELSLNAIEETCEGRRIILTTRVLGLFSPCNTEPITARGSGRAAPPNQGTQDEGDDEEDEDDGRPDLSTIFGDATPAADEGAEEETASAEVEEAIDELLAQATSCWATGDPTLFLPLHSEDALNELALFGGGLQEGAQALAAIMTSPIAFERIGAVQQLDDDRARARIAIGTGADDGVFQPQEFVLVDGEWLFDSLFILAPVEEETT